MLRTLAAKLATLEAAPLTHQPTSLAKKFTAKKLTAKKLTAKKLVKPKKDQAKYTKIKDNHAKLSALVTQWAAEQSRIKRKKFEKTWEEWKKSGLVTLTDLQRDDEIAFRAAMFNHASNSRRPKAY